MIVERPNLERRVIAALVLPFIGVVAAFGIAPNTVTDPVPLSRVVEEIELSAQRTGVGADEGYWREERIQRGDTVAIVTGNARALLTAERTALNILQRLSGIATLTAAHVAAAAGRIGAAGTAFPASSPCRAISPR